jgi:hypothetical protein
MGKADIKAAVDQHVYAMNGDLHRLRFQWAATEPRWISRGERLLVAIDVLSQYSAQPLTTVHVMTRATATREELLKLIDAAIDEQLRRARLEAGGSVDEPCSNLIA